MGLRLDKFVRRKRHGVIFRDISESLKVWNFNFSADKLAAKLRGLEEQWCKYKGRSCVNMSWFHAFSEFKAGRCPEKPKPPVPLSVSPAAGRCPDKGASLLPLSSNPAASSTTPASSCSPGTSGGSTRKSFEMIEEEELAANVPEFDEVPYRLRGEGMYRIDMCMRFTK